jgi:hypothetical protein
MIMRPAVAELTSGPPALLHHSLLLDHVAIGQREAQVTAHRQHDHIRWEAEASEGGAYERRGAKASRSHRNSLPV